MRIFALLLCATTVQAAPRVLLSSDDPALQHALEVALGPWNLEVVAVRGPPPPGALPAAAKEAARLAQAHEAAVVVWTSGSGLDAYLWIYDAESAQASARHAEMAAPVDATAAAALALSVKTMLRATTVAPPAERVGAMARPREELRLEATVGTQALFGTPSDAELRVALALAWYPHRLRRYLGLALRVETGSGIPIDRGGFSGRLIDVTLALPVRAHLPIGRRVELEPSLGLGLHITSLDGGLPPLGLRAHVVRENPSLEIGLALDVHLSRSVRLGLVATLTYLFQHQRYLVGGRPVLEMFPLQLNAGLRLAVGVL